MIQTKEQTQNDSAEYSDAWASEAIAKAEPKDDFDEAMEDQPMTAAENLAAGNGEKVAENKAAKLLGVEPTKGLSRPTLKWEKEEAAREQKDDAAAKASDPSHNNPGKDSKVISDFKAAHFDKNKEENITKLMKKGMSRESAEKMHNTARP